MGAFVAMKDCHRNLFIGCDGSAKIVAVEHAN
jgi:hypothetical protein